MLVHCLLLIVSPSSLQPRTCAPGSPSSKLSFCNTSLSMVERSEVLVKNLTLEEKINTFMLVRQLGGIPRLNIKRFRWDATDIEGVDDQVFKYNNTCYPHAIAIGATFDRQLIQELSEITSIEARVLEELYWEANGGTVSYFRCVSSHFLICIGSQNLEMSSTLGR